MEKETLLQNLSKPLKIEDVDFRIQSINKGGYATILAYKDARVDMNRLDEVCDTNWQDKYELIDGQLFCSIGIKIDKEWIWRQDVGTESKTEQTKGRASDAFKRAGFRWGIGRELYDYPLIQIKLNSKEWKIIPANGNYKEKVVQTWDLKLRDWKWSIEFKDGKVAVLIANDDKGVERFNYNVDAPKKQSQPAPDPTQTQQTSGNNSNGQQKEKAWLNVMDKNRVITPQWTNIVNAINEGKVTKISQVREHYKVSKEVEAKLNEVFQY